MKRFFFILSLFLFLPSFVFAQENFDCIFDGTSTGKTLSIPNINLTDTFHNIVITADKDGFVTMYIDNSPVGIMTMTGEPGTFDNTGILSIGRQSGTGTGAYLSGVIDDVRITNRLLTLTEIGAMYNDNIGTEEDISCWGVASDTITTINYTYDQSGQRVKKTIGNKIYIYPNKLYNIEDGKVKKHIFAGDNSIATIDDGKTIYHHTDHLSGSSVETDKDGLVVEAIDYYPFGSVRTDNQYTTYENDKKFTGYELDENDLYYAGQRYYNSDIGRFAGVDPVYLAVGMQSKDENGQKELRKYLGDPQGFNGYSYTRNNPLKYVDPTGEWFKEFFTGQQSWSSFQGEIGEATMYMSPAWQTAMDHPYATGAAVGVGGGIAAQALVASGIASNVLSGSGAIRGTVNTILNVGGQILNDKVTGNRSSTSDYAKIIGTSYVGGAVINTNSASVSAVGFGLTNAITQRVTGNHKIDPVQVAASMIGNGFGTWASNFAGRASNIGAYTAQQYGLNKIGWVLETPINAVNSELKKP